VKKNTDSILDTRVIKGIIF